MAHVRLLDLTRSLRRAGRVATGVDRVERAYLARFLADDVLVFGVVRTPLGYLLLDRPALMKFRQQLDGDLPWGRASFLSRIFRARDGTVQRAETSLRKNAIARCLPRGLSAMLSKELSDGAEYFNVGHSNLTKRMLRGVKTANFRRHMMIHDVIPLDFPQYQRQGTVEPFRAMVKRVGEFATSIIYNSEDTRNRTEEYLRKWGHVPEAIVAHLGTIAPNPRPDEVPEGLPTHRPYFVVVGTIEPRKNHAFLLDLWHEMGADAPPLLICGSRGWNNEDVFARLDALPPSSPIVEVPNVSDGAIAELVKNSAGMLFPTYAEGFGLPPVEALTLGARVLCNDLGVLREILHKKPFYASVSDAYLWISTIKSWAENPQDALETTTFSGPNWDDHFKTVLRLK